MRLEVAFVQRRGEGDLFDARLQRLGGVELRAQQVERLAQRAQRVLVGRCEADEVARGQRLDGRGPRQGAATGRRSAAAWDGGQLQSGRPALRWRLHARPRRSVQRHLLKAVALQPDAAERPAHHIQGALARDQRRMHPRTQPAVGQPLGDAQQLQPHVQPPRPQQVAPAEVRNPLAIDALQRHILQERQPREDGGLVLRVVAVHIAGRVGFGVAVLLRFA
jgi:hypothetical protein